MGLDIRLPIGGLFTVFGLVLILFGAFSDSSLYQRSLGVNINLAWGLVMLLFGLVMGLLGLWGSKSQSEKSVGRHGVGRATPGEH